TIDELKSRTLLELPSTIAISALVLIWANLVLLIKLNPGRVLEKLGYDPRSFQRWRTADWLIWPTIIAWIEVLADWKGGGDAAINVLKCIMALYGIQGLAIMSFA